MRKEEKSQLIEAIGNEIANYPYLYFVDIEGLNAVDTAKLRKLCYKNQVKLLVVKNTLLIKALEKSEVDYSELFPTFKGSNSVMLSNVNNAPAKLIESFRNNSEKPLLKSAYVEEGFYVGDAALDSLIAIKCKNELIADIVSALQSAAKNVIGALQSGGNTLSGVIKTLSERPE